MSVTFIHRTSTVGAAARCSLVLALMATAACGGEEAAPDAAAESPTIALAPQDIATARTADVATGVLLSGTLEPAERVAVPAQVAGTVGSVSVDRGTPVRRGQVLAVIAAAGVRAAALDAARANLEVAQRQRDASRPLYEGGAISELEYRRAEAAVNAAQAQVASARAQSAGAGGEASRATSTAPIAGAISDRSVESGARRSASATRCSSW